jgi:hypothetical protein
MLVVSYVGRLFPVLFNDVSSAVRAECESGNEREIWKKAERKEPWPTLKAVSRICMEHSNEKLVKLNDSQE